MANCSNSTCGEDQIDFERNAIILPVVFAVILIVGLIGNGCVISSILRYKAMRSAPNMFILNLAVGDVLMLVFAVPVAGTIYLVDNWPFGAVMCKLSYFIRTLSSGVSIFTLTALSIDRVIVIGNAMKTLHEKATVRILIMLIIVWLCAILVAIPDAVTYHLDTFIHDGDEVRWCRPTSDELDNLGYHKIHVLARFVIFFAIPVIIITICYGRMARIMMRSTRNIPGETVWIRNQRKKRKRVAYTVIVLVALFIMCWLPRNVFTMNGYFTEGAQMTEGIYYFQMISYCLLFSSSCVNPIALYCLSTAFRVHFMKQLLCCKQNRYCTTLTRNTQSHSEDTNHSKERNLNHKCDNADERTRMIRSTNTNNTKTTDAFI